MKTSLCISFRFIQPYPLFHGRRDGDKPEWPPSPMRAFQALLNAACLRTRGKPLPPEVRSALQVLEVLRPAIVAPRAILSTIGHRAYVPHNQNDLVFAALQRGMEQSTEAYRKLNGSVRTEKDFRPHRIETLGDELPTIHYLYPLDATNADPKELLAAIRPSVRSIHCLGWGIDQVVADATLVESPSELPTGECWTPAPRGGRRLRVHRNGSLDALAARHDNFLSRVVKGEWTPVPPFTAMDQVRYRSQDEPSRRPYRVFELRKPDGEWERYPQSKLIHVAGMVRHLAIEALKTDPPRGVDPDWVETYVAGHAADGSQDHRQFSYLPLPSIGMQYTDPSIRRVMIVAPLGCNAWLEHLARRLAGQQLEPDPKWGNVFGKVGPPTLIKIRSDNVTDCYTKPANRWASFTPVILPGHTDRKRNKTIKLIERSLREAGIEQACTFEWSPVSCFPKALSAHKTDREGQLIYFKPSYLQNLTAVHLTLKFNDDLQVRGPLALGAGRHCGFGLLAHHP